MRRMRSTRLRFSRFYFCYYNYRWGPVQTCSSCRRVHARTLVDAQRPGNGIVASLMTAGSLSHSRLGHHGRGQTSHVHCASAWPWALLGRE